MERGGNLNYTELGTDVDVGMIVANVVEYVAHESAVPSTHLIDDQVVVGVE